MMPPRDSNPNDQAAGHDLRLAGTERPGTPARRVMTGGPYQPDRIASEDPADQPIEEDQSDGGRLAKRLVIAGALIAGLAVINILVLRRWGADLPPEIMLFSFAVILVASVLSLFEGSAKTADDDDDQSTALTTRGDTRNREPNEPRCVSGVCPGPRLPRFLRF